MLIKQVGKLLFCATINLRNTKYTKLNIHTTIFQNLVRIKLETSVLYEEYGRRCSMSF